MKKAAVVPLIIVCVTVAAIIALKSRDKVFASGSDVAQSLSEALTPTQKYDNQIYVRHQANKKGTFFLIKFRQVYYENEEFVHKLFAVLSTFVACSSDAYKNMYTLSCTKKDIKKIREFAKQGDLFSLAVMVFWDRKNWRGKALLAGEPITTVRAANITEREKAERMLMNLGESFPHISATQLLDFYENIDRRDDFCKTAERAYKDFGIFTISRYFTYNQEKGKDLLFNYCDLFDKRKTKEDILNEMGTDEARLILGYKYVGEEKYEDAMDIFKELYRSDDSLVSINAGFCLGIMLYYGKSQPIDTANGMEMIKEAHNKGYSHSSITAFPDRRIGRFFPVKNKIIKNTWNTCGEMAAQ
jgi:hypothetical protein